MMKGHCWKNGLIKRSDMDNFQQVKAKLEQMKAKYNFERESEDNPNHSDGWGMFYSGFFACLKEISFFVDNIE